MFGGYTFAVVKIEYLYTDTDNGQTSVTQRTIEGLCVSVKEADQLIETLESMEDSWTERQIIAI
jgi:hypothetical protein